MHEEERFPYAKGRVRLDLGLLAAAALVLYGLQERIDGFARPGSVPALRDTPWGRGALESRGPSPQGTLSEGALHPPGMDR